MSGGDSPCIGLEIRFGFKSNHKRDGQERLWGASCFAAPGALIMPIANFAVPFSGLDPWDARPLHVCHTLRRPVRAELQDGSLRQVASRRRQRRKTLHPRIAAGTATVAATMPRSVQLGSGKSQSVIVKIATLVPATARHRQSEAIPFGRCAMPAHCKRPAVRTSPKRTPAKTEVKTG